MNKDGKHFAQDCTKCKTAVVFEIVGQHAWQGDSDQFPIELYLAKCGNCGVASLFCREDYGEGFEADTFYRMYPAQRRQLRFFLPSEVEASYDEAVKCEGAKAWTALAVMVGRTLEAVAKQYYPGATLAAALKKMLADGIISEEIHEWSTHLRVIRNIGAHPSKEKIDSQEATEALDFAQAILEILYDLRPKFEQMKKRRTK